MLPAKLITILKPTLALRNFSVRQLFALLTISQAKIERIDHGDLKRQLGLSGAVCSRAVDGLSIMGFVRRERYQEDRRKVWIILTKQGREFVQKLTSHNEGANP